MKVFVTEPAEDDLARAFVFHQRKSPQLGNYFLESIQNDLLSLGHLGGIHEKTGHFHRMLGKKFPVAIFYSIQQEQVFIHAVLDARRSPEWQARRLGFDPDN